MSAPHGWRIRYQMAAQKSPVKYGILSGIASGVLFGSFIALYQAFFSPGGSDPSAGSVAAGAVAGGVFFGACVGVFASLMHRSVFQASPLPPDTRPGQIRAAQRLMRSGYPGQDPQQNELARIQAKRMLATLWWPKTFLTVFLLGMTLNAGSLLVPGPGGAQFWIHLLGVIFFAVMGLVALPLSARQRRRAQDFMAATDPQKQNEQLGQADRTTDQPE